MKIYVLMYKCKASEKWHPLNAYESIQYANEGMKSVYNQTANYDYMIKETEVDV